MTPAETCGKPLERTKGERWAVRAVTAAVDAALGEVTRQGGGLGNIAIEARGHGVSVGLMLLPRCERASDHEGDCDSHAHRGVDYDCEECGKRVGFVLERGWRRCRGCGYPGQ